MFDFINVKEAINNDLKQISVQNYLFLKELNYLPKEINLIIVYNRLQISDELITLNEDIEYSHKDSIFRLLKESKFYNIDIFSKYDQYLEKSTNKRLFGGKNSIYNPKIRDAQNNCLDILYSLDKYIFYKLLFDYSSKTNSDLYDYEHRYSLNLNYYIKKTEWKSDKKYIKLLKIIDLNNLLKLSLK